MLMKMRGSPARVRSRTATRLTYTHRCITVYFDVCKIRMKDTWWSVAARAGVFILSDVRKETSFNCTKDILYIYI